MLIVIPVVKRNHRCRGLGERTLGESWSEHGTGAILGPAGGCCQGTCRPGQGRFVVKVRESSPPEALHKDRPLVGRPLIPVRHSPPSPPTLADSLPSASPYYFRRLCRRHPQSANPPRGQETATLADCGAGYANPQI